MRRKMGGRGSFIRYKAFHFSHIYDTLITEMPTRALYVIINVAIQILNPNFGLFFFTAYKR